MQSLTCYLLEFSFYSKRNLNIDTLSVHLVGLNTGFIKKIRFHVRPRFEGQSRRQKNKQTEK